ncbi:hypothetical protein E2553_04755 [Paraburkholderia dipogonis]|uniref:Uncharacterized protein n=1 Tax=Paraburkholderia dipogonis TaxID=1211383 RepID=A0A4Y8N3M7_9BURK|nr:hypothetical protein E2553_04755 [Paraburkholderia dipogonis]
MGSAAAPGGAGEALVGQTSSSGVRLSDFMFNDAYAFSAKLSQRMHHACRSLASLLAAPIGRMPASPLAFACNSVPFARPFLTHRSALFSYTR